MHRFFKIPLNENVILSSRINFALKKSQTSALNYNCWSCDRHLNENEFKLFFCPCSKSKILPPVNNWKLQRNYFEIFGLSVDFNLNKKELTKSFRKLMQKLHPDLFAQKDEVFFSSGKLNELLLRVFLILKRLKKSTRPFIQV